MSRHRTWTILALTAALLPLAGGALAEDSRREQQQQQRAHQNNEQIDEQVRKGNLTPDEARALKLDEDNATQRPRTR